MPESDQVNQYETTILEALTAAESAENVALLFVERVYESLATLKADDVGAWNRVRHQLKGRGRKIGLYLAVLEAEVEKWEQSQQQVVATTDTDMILGARQLIRDPNAGEVYVQIQVAGVTETAAAGSRQFTDYVIYRHLTLIGKAPSKALVQRVIDTVTAKARFDRATLDVEVLSRWAERDGKVFCNIADGSGRVIEIGANKWAMKEQSPVVFHAPAGSLGMPCPVSNNDGDLELLWHYVPCAAEDRVLVLAWLLESYRVRTPYPILQLVGTQGSAKSSSCKYLRALIDPQSVGLRAAPKSARDVAIAARNNYLLAYNNLSPGLAAGSEDMLCSISTGGGFAARQLYTDQAECAFDIRRPVMVNGIESVFTQQDLIDRLITIEMPPIEDGYLTEEELDKCYQLDAPKTFVGLLNLMVAVLGKLADGGVVASPEFRMQDFARLGRAIGAELGSDFETVYRENRREPLLHALDGIPALVALQRMVREKGDIESIAVGVLWKKLEKQYRTGCEDWPRSAKGFANLLIRNERGLNEAGVLIKRLQRQNDGWHYAVRRHRPPLAAVK